MAVRMAQHLMARLPELRFEPVTRRIRCLVDDEAVADTTDAMLVWEPRRIVPVYALPPDDIHADLIPFTSAASPDLDTLPPVLGPEFGIHTCDGEALSLLVGGRELPGVAFRPDDPELGGRITLDWPTFDWIEEEQPVIAHPHDPFGRIDVLSASRHVVVSLDGVTLADSRRPVGVFETHLRRAGTCRTRTCGWTCSRPAKRRRSTRTRVTPATSRWRAAHPPAATSPWTYTDPLHEVAAVKDRVVLLRRTHRSRTRPRAHRAGPCKPRPSPEEQESESYLDFG